VAIAEIHPERYQIVRTRHVFHGLDRAHTDVDLIQQVMVGWGAATSMFIMLVSA